VNSLQVREQHNILLLHRVESDPLNIYIVGICCINIIHIIAASKYNSCMLNVNTNRMQYCKTNMCLSKYQYYTLYMGILSS